MSQKHNIGSTDFSVFVDNNVTRIYQSTHNSNARGKTICQLPSGKSVKAWRADLKEVCESFEGTKAERAESLKLHVASIS